MHTLQHTSTINIYVYVTALCVLFIIIIVIIFAVKSSRGRFINIFAKVPIKSLTKNAKKQNEIQ